LGTDALRISLIIGTGPGNDSRISEDKIRGYKNFANKIWNIARFVATNTEGIDFSTTPELSEDDKADLKALDETIADVTKDLDAFRFYLAGEKLYHYIWHTLADVIIEKSKARLQSENAAEKLAAQYTLQTILETCLKLIHPFMPFVTEEIWTLLGKPGFLMVEKWPISKN
jgi:valyl-tRNA synthetase